MYIIVYNSTWWAFATLIVRNTHCKEWYGQSLYEFVWNYREYCWLMFDYISFHIRTYYACYTSEYIMNYIIKTILYVLVDNVLATIVQQRFVEC